MDWSFQNLGTTCDILDNRRKPITKSKRISGPFPYYGATGIVDFVNDFIFDERLVLVGEDGAKWNSGDNTAFIVEGKVWVNNHAHVLRTRGNLNDKFLVYYLNHQDLSDYITGLTVPKLNQEKLRSIPVPIPPLSEQQAIVKKLNAAFELIDQAKANIEKNIQNAKELFQSKLNEVFSQKGDGWEERKLDEVTIIKGRIGYRGYTKEDLVNKGEGAITLSPSNIVNNRFHTNNCTYISWFKYEESPEIMVFDGDILFVKTGSTYGKVAIVENLSEKATINPQFVVLKNIKINNKFLFYSLTTKIFKEKVESIVGGTATPTLSQTNLGNLTIYHPNLETQQEIVAQLDELSAKTEQLQQKYQQKLANLEELRKSILEKAFKGELV